LSRGIEQQHFYLSGKKCGTGSARTTSVRHEDVESSAKDVGI
jgi:hypothetical protein